MPCGKMESRIEFRQPLSWTDNIWIEWWWEEIKDILLAHEEEVGEWAW